MNDISLEQFQRHWCAPDHPVSCANPAPWQIKYVKFDTHPFKVWIRGDNSMWFRADQCFIHEDKEEAQLYVEMRKR